MRFLYGLVAIFIWGIMILFLRGKGLEISNDMQVLTVAIVFAGAMAGGD